MEVTDFKVVIFKDSIAEGIKVGHGFSLGSGSRITLVLGMTQLVNVMRIT